MDDLTARKHILVAANRILAAENVLDALGHVSMRHPERPDRFFMARSRSPELVTFDDIMEFDLDCNPIDQQGRPLYTERPIHGGIYQSRPEVNGVVHNHVHAVIPFSVTKVPLKPMIHVGALIDGEVPVWDIATQFGDGTDLLVRNMDQGRDLASFLGDRSCALMRGHGCVTAGKTLEYAVLVTIYLTINAKLQNVAMQMGEVQYLSEAEVEAARDMMSSDLAVERIWEYYMRRVSHPTN